MKACRKKRFTNALDAILTGSKAFPQYRWKAHFCRVCLAWHMTTKKTHGGYRRTSEGYK